MCRREVQSAIISNNIAPCTGGPSGRQPGAIFQLQGRERRTPSDGAPIYQGSFFSFSFFVYFCDKSQGLDHKQQCTRRGPSPFKIFIVVYKNVFIFSIKKKIKRIRSKAKICLMTFSL